MHCSNFAEDDWRTLSMLKRWEKVHKILVNQHKTSDKQGLFYFSVFLYFFPTDFEMTFQCQVKLFNIDRWYFSVHAFRLIGCILVISAQCVDKNSNFWRKTYFPRFHSKRSKVYLGEKISNPIQTIVHFMKVVFPCFACKVVFLIYYDELSRTMVWDVT